MHRNHILAARLWLQTVRGSTPYTEMSKIGDSWTARGYKADRLPDRAKMLSSLEYRFPPYKKLGGVLFIDTGRVFPGLTKFSFAGWHSNRGLGLRFYLTNFVVRTDVGKSREGKWNAAKPPAVLFLGLPQWFRYSS